MEEALIINGGEHAERCRQSFDLLIKGAWVCRPLAGGCLKTHALVPLARAECFVSRFATYSRTAFPGIQYNLLICTNEISGSRQ